MTAQIIQFPYPNEFERNVSLLVAVLRDLRTGERSPSTEGERKLQEWLQGQD